MAMTDDDLTAQDDHPEVIVATERQDQGRSRADSALERAAEAALSLPTLPGRDEFLALAMQARILSMSGAAPRAVQGNPHLAFHIAMVGRDLGISPSAALNLVDVIDGKKGPQLSLSPQLMNGQIARLGLGRILPVIRTAERCVAVAVEPGGRVDVRCRGTWPAHVEDCRCAGVIGESEFTWEMAQAAGLAMADCRPGAHTTKCRNHNSKSWEKCNTGYQNYPERMLWWRAAGFAADDYFPEAGLGLYSPEELGAVVDAEGRPVDPGTVSLPEGYEPRQIAPEPPAAPEVVDDLKARIKALWPHTDARAAFVELWNRSDGTQPLPHVEQLLARQVNRARAVVKAIEDRMAKGDFGQAPEPTPEARQEAQEAPAQAGTGDDTGQADSGAPAPAQAEQGDDEDHRAAELAQEANRQAWSVHLSDVRQHLRSLGLDDQGEPDVVRRRLESELLRRTLLAEAQASGSLMEALSEVVPSEAPSE